MLVASALVLVGCGQSQQANLANFTVQKKIAETVYEAEEAQMSGNVTSKAEGDVSFADGFTADGDSVTFTINIEETGFYDLDVVSRSDDGGKKENYLLVDSDNMGVLKLEGKEFTDSEIKRVYLEKGSHEVMVQKYWGWIQIDKLVVRQAEELDESRFDIEPVLVNANATDNTKRLMTYLCDTYGKQIISGQYCDGGMYGHENACIWKATGGKYPAILGLDMMEYSPSRVANGSNPKSADYAIDYWNEGGIVTFCWHWNAPQKYLTGVWYSGFYTDNTNIDLGKIMSGQDQEGYDLLMGDIDAIAKQLGKLQDAGVPVLWRPLHEAAGGWFWWGASGADAYKELYKLLYDKLTNEYGLNNLIWVWNGQDKDWYPGDEYVDIIGEDIYPGEHVYTPQTSKYLEVLNYTEAKKMVVLSENGCLFDPDLAVRDGSMWGYFGTWGGEFVSSSNSLNILSEQYTEEDMLKKVYDSEYIITRDELPDLKNYPLRDESK